VVGPLTPYASKVISICALFLPEVGSPTCTELETMSPATKFIDDVEGVPVASPGRTDKNPLAVGATTVTFSNAPVRSEFVTRSLRGTPDWNWPVSPMLLRVSRMRIGSIVTTDDGGPSAALTVMSPPAPSVTATAAPIAAHLERHNRGRPSFSRNLFM
jgi:hypothetical protein